MIMLQTSVLPRLCFLLFFFLTLTAQAGELSVVPEAETFPWVVITQEEMELREGPGTGYKSLGTLDKGAAIYAVARVDEGNWVKVQFKEHNKGDMEGYLDGRYLAYHAQLDPHHEVQSRKRWEPINIDDTIFGKIWSIIKVILLIATIVVVLAFKDELMALFSGVLFFAAIGALIGWLVFKNGSAGAWTGAVIGLLAGLRYVIHLEWVVALLASILSLWYYIVSFPFYLLNQAQYFLTEPWRSFFKFDRKNDSAKPRLRTALEVLQVILYILTTPLRLVNAIYFNLFVHCTVVLYDLFMEVFVPCSEKDGAGSFWGWLLLIPWRIIKYPVVHGIVAVLESVAWTVIDIFIPAITLYHGTDLTAGQSIAGSRRRNAELTWKSGTFTASESSWGGIGVYFAPRRSVARVYANSPHRLSDQNPVVIVCRVSLGRIINYSLAPSRVYKAAGQDGHPPTLNHFAENNGFTTGEWWNERGGYWEYCLFDWQNLYNSRWRIRPVYLFNDRTHFIQHIKGGMTHWTFNF